MPCHLLFDIDGTLIDSCPPHGKAIYAAVRDVYGIEVTGHGIAMAGMTDWQIVREMLARAGLEVGAIDASMPNLVERASDLFDELVESEHVVELPQARDTVHRLQAAGHHLSLVTGNFVRIAHRKMELLGLDSHFPIGIGGFGSDHFHRPELPKFAISRAKQKYQTDEESAFIVGDTVRDIEAGKANGIPVIAVATGKHGPSVEQLKAAGAEYAIRDLSEFPWDNLHFSRLEGRNGG